MKKIKIMGVLISIILAVLLHFMYNVMPGSITSIIAPVNESIWEHMKLITTSSLLFGIFEYYLYKKKGIMFNNFILAYGVSNILAIITYLIIYVPLFDMFGHKVFVAIGLLILIFIFLAWITYYIMNYKKIAYANEIGILLIIIIYLVFGYFTYQTPKINLFYDHLNKGYGIIKRMN